MHVISSEQRYRGKNIGLRTDRVRSPDGGEQRVDVVEHNGAVVIIAQPEPLHVVLVRQYRHAVGQLLWEIPAGTIERGEQPLATAHRELAEETGYRAQRMTKLWTAYSAPGFCEELLHFFLAEGLSAGPTAFDDGEDIETAVFSVAEAWAMVQRDELPDAKTQIALAALRSRPASAMQPPA